MLEDLVNGLVVITPGCEGPASIHSYYCGHTLLFFPINELLYCHAYHFSKMKNDVYLDHIHLRIFARIIK